MVAKKEGRNMAYSATWAGDPSQLLPLHLDFTKSTEVAILEPAGTFGLKLNVTIQGGGKEQRLCKVPLREHLARSLWAEPCTYAAPCRPSSP